LRDYKQDTKDEGKLLDETICCEILKGGWRSTFFLPLLDLPIKMIELAFFGISS